MEWEEMEAAEKSIWRISGRKSEEECGGKENKAGYTANPVACGWAGAIIEVSGAFGQAQ